MGRSGYSTNKAAHTLRVVGGLWRGRRLTFADVPGLRPTPDRVRETLFNWLQAHIEGSVCLDLFAGSGALGFEAASRGAAQVVMVDKNSSVVHHLQRQKAMLNAAHIRIVCSDALDWLQESNQIFNNVFLDPPFSEKLLDDVIRLLQNSRAVTVETRIYLEAQADLPAPELPQGWEYLRSKRAGRVKFYLAVVRRS